MRDVLKGIRVVELAQYWFVPAAGAILADWGADVVKIEHPVRGDAQRGLAAMGYGVREGGVDFMMQQSNRGKRSVGLDVAKPEGRALLLELVRRADVFVTNFLPEARAKLGVDVDDVRAVNERIVYVRGSGHGPEGPDRDKGGYDATAFWFRGGLAHALTPEGAARPVMQRAAFGDAIGALTLAGGVAAALFRREREGVGAVVDVSLLATALWTLAPDVVASKLLEPGRALPVPRRESAANPIANAYRTKDGRWLMLLALEADRYWAEVCRHVGRPELADDPRGRDARARFEHREALIRELDAAFAEHALDEWRTRLATLGAPWAPMQSAAELHDDPQVVANGYLPDVERAGGGALALVASPVAFDEAPPMPAGPAPEMGQHTEEVLLELGLDWDALGRLKAAGVIA